MDPNKYPLSDYDIARIKPLCQQIQDKGLGFRYLMTITYWYTNKDYGKCLKDAHKTRKVLRDFFKSGIRCWFFVEKHTDPTQKNYGGFHLHSLIEDPSERWQRLTERQKQWLEGWDEQEHSTGAGALVGGTPSRKQKMLLIQKVVQRLQKQTLPQGAKGVDLREIYDLDPCLSYCTKQFEHFLPSYEVIAAPSDIDFDFFIKNKQYGLQYRKR